MTTRTLAAPLIAVTLLLGGLTACWEPIDTDDKIGTDDTVVSTDDSNSATPDEICDNGDDDDNDGATDCDDSDCEGAAACVESNCTDGLDDDGDGAIDCADDDCAAEFQCTWPDTMTHRTLADFAGRTIECEFFGHYDVDVDDCRTDLNSNLSVIAEGSLCTSCDRTYEGPFVVTEDSCGDVTGATPPTTARFGFVFNSPTERVLWAQDDSGVWQETVTLTLAGNSWEFSGTDAVVADPDGCNNGDQHLGDLTVTLSFQDN